MVNADAAPVEGEDAAGPIFVTPLMGALGAGESMEISAVFAPPKAPRPAKGYVATASEAESDEKYGREAHKVEYAIEVLETGQKVSLGLKGEALAPRVSPSRSALGFGECAQYERAELPLTLTNHAPLPVSVSFGRAANFSVAPASLTLPASGTATATVTFEPHQLGPLKGSVQMSYFGDRVGSQTLHLSGHCIAPARRVPAGGVGKLPEHFDAERTARLVQAGQLGGTRAFSRLPAWQTVHGVTAQGLSVVDSLRKRKTFEAQQALQHNTLPVALALTPLYLPYISPTSPATSSSASTRVASSSACRGSEELQRIAAAPTVLGLTLRVKGRVGVGVRVRVGWLGLQIGHVGQGAIRLRAGQPQLRLERRDPRQ